MGDGVRWVSTRMHERASTDHGPQDRSSGVRLDDDVHGHAAEAEAAVVVATAAHRRC